MATTTVQPVSSPRPAWLIWSAMALPFVSLAVVILADHSLMLMAAGALAVAAILAIFIYPEAATPLVVFVLYTNAAAVAVQLHGVPIVAAAAVPMLLGIPLAYHVLWRRQPVIITPAVPLIVLFVIVQLVGVWFAVEPDTAAAEVKDSIFEGLLLYLLVSNVIRTPQMLRRVAWAIVLAAGLMGSLGLHQQLTHNYDRNYGGFAQVSNAAFMAQGHEGAKEQPRLAGPIGEKNYYAQFMLMALPLAVFCFTSERALLLRCVSAITAVLIGAGIALTFSRGAALSFVVVLLAMSGLGYLRFRHLAAVGLLLLGSIAVLVPEATTRLQSTIARLAPVVGSPHEGVANADASTQSRLTEMLAAVMVFVDHPIVGVGPGMFRYHYEDYADILGYRLLAHDRAAHNLYLGIAAEHGLLGLVAFLGILWVTIRGLLHARRQHRQPELAVMSTALLVSLIGFMASGMFLSFAYVRYFWLVAAVAGAAGYLGQTATENTSIEPGENP